jgi:hypothetical protein
MMKRHPKTEEDMQEMEERRRDTRNVFSAAAGIGAYAVVGTANLPLPTERGIC